jgi:ABC-type transport system involved in multi-copper enzyme maturation permease subunit
MIGRNGLGPVFVYDMLALARRWQVYAARAAFVLFLLIGMTIAWSSSQRNGLISGGTPTLQQLAKIGENFFYALAGIQLSFILLAAPASAAGSICIDRARGTLLHMMVTDLSDAEIVLGRLGARLLPVFGFVACGVPVLALAGLLGGIVFEALMGLIVVSIALAILGQGVEDS